MLITPNKTQSWVVLKPSIAVFLCNELNGGQMGKKMIMDRTSSVAIIIIFLSDPPLIEGQVFLQIEYAFSYFSVMLAI